MNSPTLVLPRELRGSGTAPCRGCGLRLPKDCFYADGSRGAGVSRDCRACGPNRVRRYLKGLSPAGRRRRNALVEARRTEREDLDPAYRLKRAARRSAMAARRHGLIHRPGACEVCNTVPEAGPLEAHHPNHRDALRVIFVCGPCHRRLPHHDVVGAAAERGAA